MSRICCTVCLRPEKTCICHLFCHIDNNVNVIVLQHPTEVNQTKGTVTLLANSLQQCDVIVGENFSDNAEVTQAIKKYRNNVYLLYPNENATVLTPYKSPYKLTPPKLSTTKVKAKESNNLVIQTESKDSLFNRSDVKCIIVLDGTWKKAYKMYMLNTFLHELPHLTLPTSMQGEYKIRKTQKENALSSLEACAYALMSLESNDDKYQPLLSSFHKFNDFQMAYRK